MAIKLNLGQGGVDLASETIGGEEYELIKLNFGVAGVATPVSASDPLPTIEAVPTTVYNGKTVVTTSGTRVTLAASTTVKSVTIKALATNTGVIYVGNATVSSANGFQLAAGDSVSMDISNLNTIYFDSSVNGEGVTYLANN